MSNLGHNVSLVDFLPWNSPAWDCGVMGHFQVRHESVSAMTAIDTMWGTLTTLLVIFKADFYTNSRSKSNMSALVVSSLGGSYLPWLCDSSTQR